jgi:hypothetical protein
MKVKTIGRLAAAAYVYRKLLRRQILTWGATAEEAAAHLPGDELLADADGVATRAITIDAPVISRNRFRLPRLIDKIGMIHMEPGSLVMERKMLNGIKERAERPASHRSAVRGGPGVHARRSLSR